MRWSSGLLAELLLLLSLGARAEPLQVQRITPEGVDVKDSRQIVIAFDRAVVPLGRMEREPEEVPVNITPGLRCDWRWLDPQTLACQLPRDEKLKLATRYRVELRPELVSEQGERLERSVTGSFVTERPQLQYSRITRWDGPGLPVVYLRFSQPVTETSVREALRFGGVGVRAMADPDDREMPFASPGGEARQQWLITPEHALPLDSDEPLQLRAGLASVYGEERASEAREALALRTFPGLRLLGVSCARLSTPGSEPQWGLAGAGERCDPLGGVTLSFSAPVRVAAIKPRLQLDPDPRKAFRNPKHDPWANQGEVEGEAEDEFGSHEKGRSYGVALPFSFVGGTHYRGALADGVQDIFGRPLGATVFAFDTGDRTPRLVFEHTRAVIEAGVDSEVPAVVTNLDALDARFERMTADGVQPGEQRIAVPRVRNLAFALPLELRRMLGGGSGAVLGTLSTTPKTSETPRRFFAEVTPWQVHAKLGHSNLLVWVTEMATGKPVTNAQVSVLAGFGGTVRASAETNGQGLAELPGSQALDPTLEQSGWQPEKTLYLRVLKDRDVALLPLDYEFQVDVYRASRNQFSQSRRPRHGHLRAWGTTAQGVYRAGETLQYKLYVRDEPGRTLEPAPRSAYTLKVYDPLGNTVLERGGLALSAFGALAGELKLAERAPVGWYRFELTPEYAKEQTLEALQVLVSDFTPAPFRVGAEWHAHAAQPGDALETLLAARLHGGGPFAGAAARLVLRIDAQGFQPKDPLAAQFSFDSGGQRPVDPLLDSELHLDAEGQWKQAVRIPETDIAYGQLVADATVQDDRGRGIGSQARIPYYGRDRYAGLRWDGWLLKQSEAATVDAIVVDTAGTPLRGVPYYVKVERQETQGARVKGAGNAYITRYVQRWKRIATCHGRSRRDGMGCRFTPDAAGEYRVTVMTRDSRNRLHQSQTWIYAQGRGEVLWEESPDYSLGLRADRLDYEAGDTARILVKNPFPGARALVTVERYGVLDRWVKKLRGATPEIAIPIKPEYFPGAYVSVVVMSPRVEQPLKDGVDLGKPTFRMGYLQLKLRDPVRELKVEVRPQRDELRPRETAEIELQARPRTKGRRGDKIEFAVAVLDEAVFDLIKGGPDYFDPLKGFTRLDPLDLANYSLLTRLVGRQKFEKKGASPGGDGGGDLSLRNVDRYVAYWNPSLPADGNGRARFRFQTPDNLTGWRILALAVTPGDRMGLGQGLVKVSKLTELRPAMPNQVTAGDRFDAGFTVLNRAKTERRIEVQLVASGAARGERRETLTLKPFERRTLVLPLQTEGPGEIQFSASAGSGKNGDALAHQLPVRVRQPNITVADYGHFEAGATVQIPLRLPPTLERGELKLSFTPSVLGGLDGSFAYLRSYPYLCWEQRISKALMAAHYLKLRPRLQNVEDWPQAAELVQATLDQAASFQAPEGGMAFWRPQSERQSPYLSAYTALAFVWLQDLGYTPPKPVWDRLDAYLQRLLREDLRGEGFEVPEARAQLRAVALAALAPRGALKAGDLERYGSALPRMGLFGQSLFLQAATRLDAADAREQALRLILSRGQESAGRLALREDEAASWNAWLLGSPLRANCAALSALTQRHGDDPALAELPMKLARSISKARGQRSHWSNTQETLFCTRAFIEYADRFESVTPDLVARGLLGATPLGEVRVTREAGGVLTRPVTATEAGQGAPLSIHSEGQGRAYFSASLRYAERASAAKAINAGLEVRREYFLLREGRWVKLEAPLRVKRGDKVRVELQLTVPAWATYVAVDDPVPGGLEPINPALANVPADDAALAEGGSYAFYHRELRHEAVRFFADSVDEGEYRMAWIGTAVASGEFAAAETHAELMYSPEVFGNGVPGHLLVTE